MQGKISKRLVDSLAPSSTELFVWDTDVKGFGLKLTPTGKRVYLLQYRSSGRLRRYTIGTHGSPWTPEAARQEAGRLLGLIAMGKDPSEQKAQAKAMPTMAELCDIYLAEGTAAKKASTLAIDRGRITRHIVPLLGRKRVDQITRADIQRFMIAVAEGKTATDEKTGPKGRAIVTGGKGTATRCMGFLGGILAFAVERGYRTDNPVHGVKKYPEQRRERFLTADELTRLGEALQQSEQEGVNPFAVNALRLLLLSGMRRGEVLTLQWSHVDFEQGCLRLPDSKTGAKIVHIGAAAFELLARLPRIEGNPYCFPGAVEGQSLVGLPKIWRKIRDRAGLPDVRIHDTRHGFASIGVISGMGLPVVGALLGHKTPSVTARYAHLSADPLKLAADRISGQIAAALNGTPKAEVVQLPKIHANQGG
ncbi:MAG: tyrosine-type recombinase/integrase [Nitrospirae bacterium]|nr:tyrosine-type recombinase/integrase [Magnetococcales bacterium]HAT50873.1 integrase [Alphaproteobacteria bacterium]